MNTTGLLEPQVAHAKRLLDSLYLNGVASDLSETGCGKTYVSAAIARGINCPVSVIAPKLVLKEWEKVLGMFGVKADVLINYEKLCRGNTPWLSWDYDSEIEKEHGRWMNANIKFPAGSLVILDESHKCKGYTSLQAGMMIALKRQGYRVLMLSATQATNPLEMRAYGYAINMHKLEMKDFKQFCRDCGAEDVGKWGAQFFNLDDKEAQEKMRRLHINLFDHQKIASRITRDDMGSLFPENQIIAQAYDMGKASTSIKSIYDNMEDDIARLEERTQEYSSCVLALITKARRMVEMQKVPAFIGMIEDAWDEGKSIVTFVNYTDTIEAINKRLLQNPKFRKDGVGLIYGGRSHKRREEDLEAFQADRIRVLICNLAAGGQSINLHDLHGNRPRVSLINPSYSAIHLLQALGRIHRQGGLTKCYQRIVYAAGTIEEKACHRVQFKLNNLSVLNDGDLTGAVSLFNYVKGMSV